MELPNNNFNLAPQFEHLTISTAGTLTIDMAATGVNISTSAMSPSYSHISTSGVQVNSSVPNIVSPTGSSSNQLANKGGSALSPTYTHITTSVMSVNSTESITMSPASNNGNNNNTLSPTYTHISTSGPQINVATVSNTVSPSPMNPNNSNNNNNLLSPILMEYGIFPGVAAATTTLDYTTSIDIPDTKEGIEELCPVCGDKVSGYHYGLLTCESCKGFFKRTVQNKKVYTCVADRSCQIDKTQRKRCPYCRFQKCLDVGMKLEAVRADRMRGGRNKFGPMYKRDRARKLQMMRQRQLSHQGLMTSRGMPTSSAVGITYSAAYSSTSPIKEEIQSPFLSSSTSSPDSSPAPMQGMCTIQPSVTTMTVSPTGGANNSGMGGQEVSVWVGAAPSAASGMGGNPGGGTNGVGNASNNRLGVVGGGSSPSVPTPNGGLSRVPSLIRQLVAQVDDNEWQSSLYSLLQNQTYNQCEVDLFELLCKVLDQNLFSQVDWARNSFFFKDLRVDDQMKLLQQSWSDMLIIDHLHQRIHNKLQDEITLPNGQKFDLLSLALLGTTQFGDRFHEVMNKLIDLKFDISDYICLKFIILLNPEVRNLNDRRSVSTAHDQVQQTLIEYCHAVYPEEQDRYQRLMELVPELHYIADNGERYLYFKHMHGAAPSQTLLMEMLHTKRR